MSDSHGGFGVLGDDQSRPIIQERLAFMVSRLGPGQPETPRESEQIAAGVDADQDAHRGHHRDQ